jgi:hypothetical protein
MSPSVLSDSESLIPWLRGCRRQCRFCTSDTELDDERISRSQARCLRPFCAG